MSPRKPAALAAFLCFLMLILAHASCFGQIEAASKYEPFEPICLDVKTDAPEGAKVNAVWRIEAPASYRQKSATEVFVWAPPGTYRVHALVWITRTVTVDGIEGQLLAGPPQEFNESFTVSGKPPPKPKPDPEPGPDPEPEGDSPFAESGLRVLIIYEVDDVAGYSKEHRSQIYGKELRQWAMANCVKASSGSTEFRCLDDDVVSGPNADQKWSQALRRPRSQLPWLVVGNGKSGFEGPLPKTLAETTALLERYR